SRNLRIVEKRIGKITLAKANRNSSPTYSLVLFAPSHSLRMGDFFRKAVKINRVCRFPPALKMDGFQNRPGFPVHAAPDRQNGFSKRERDHITGQLIHGFTKLYSFRTVQWLQVFKIFNEQMDVFSG
ncbi:hypothetical protein, partial [Heyndrickxia coagulans]|uniref:hypothetical protein n=1 Tax=Heyndrickxia coagulans TaxID=1398 RepID=UPI001F2243B1